MPGGRPRWTPVRIAAFGTLDRIRSTGRLTAAEFPSLQQIHKSKFKEATHVSESTLIASGSKLTREELALVPTPVGTATHRPIPHAEVVTALTETLGFRHIA